MSGNEAPIEGSPAVARTIGIAIAITAIAVVAIILVMVMLDVDIFTPSGG